MSTKVEKRIVVVVPVSTAYNQPPHPSFFIGEGMQTPAAPSVFYAGTDK